MITRGPGSIVGSRENHLMTIPTANDESEPQRLALPDEHG